ncbi:MAG: carotenoid biosynthesis protein [Marinilabilia sp.]
MMYLKKYLTAEKINLFWLIYYSVGILGFTIPVTRDFFRELIGFSILLSLILMLLFHQPWSPRFLLASAMVVFGGFGIEVLGVNTGLVFGEYSYGANLGPLIFGTPVLIGLNWWMLIYIVSQLMRGTRIPVISQLLLGALVMTGYDLFLEPVAIATGMWGWNGQGVPMLNYLAWFLISFLFLSVFRLLKTDYNNPVSTGLLTAQTGFFILLNIIHQTGGL